MRSGRNDGCGIEKLTRKSAMSPPESHREAGQMAALPIRGSDAVHPYKLCAELGVLAMRRYGGLGVVTYRRREVLRMQSLVKR